MPTKKPTKTPTVIEPAPEPTPRDLSEFRVKPPVAPKEELFEPRDVYAAVSNAFIACSRAVAFDRITEGHRRKLREFGEELITALTSFDESMGPEKTRLFAEIKEEELMLVLSVLLKLSVLRAYPTGLPSSAYRGGE